MESADDLRTGAERPRGEPCCVGEASKAMRMRWTLIVVAAVTLGVGVLAPSPAVAAPLGTTSFSMAGLLSVAGVISPATADPADAASNSVTIEVGQHPTQDVATTITVSGETEAARKLYVYVSRESWCESDPSNAFGTALSESGGEAISAGEFSKTYTYTPSEATTYRVCAYVDEGGYATPDASNYASFTAAMPSASVAVVVSPTLSENTPVTITVSGETEVARKLYVYVSRESWCESDPSNAFGTALSESGGEAISAGEFNKTYSYTPSQTATYMVCAYVDEGGYGTPDATGTGTDANVTPQTRAEEAKLAAEAKAREEQAAAEAAKIAAQKAAEVKKKEEEQAKKKYEAEAPAREAAQKAAEAAKREAELAAMKAQAHKTPVKHLSVKAVPHARHSSADPGFTDLDITTSPYAYVVVKLSRYGQSTKRFEWGNYSSRAAEVIRWSCKSPGGTYQYVVTAKSDVGRTLRRRGRFAPVSVTRCHALKKQEAEARERKAAEEKATERAEREQEKAAHGRGEVGPGIEAKRDQRALCESGLNGLGESGHVVESREEQGMFLEEDAQEVITVCKVIFYRAPARYYTLKGDHPIKITGGGTTEPGL